MLDGDGPKWKTNGLVDGRKVEPISNPNPNIAVEISRVAVRSQTHCIILMYTICSPAARSLPDVSVIISVPGLTGPSVPHRSSTVDRLVTKE